MSHSMQILEWYTSSVLFKRNISIFKNVEFMTIKIMWDFNIVIDKLNQTEESFALYKLKILI